MIKAINNKIIVEYLKPSQTISGLIIPEGSQEPQGYGRVLSVGEEIKNIRKGIILVFHVRAGMDMILGSKVYKCVNAEEVYGELTDKKILKTLEPLDLEMKKIAVPEKKIIL